MHSSTTSFGEWINALGPGERTPVIIVGIVLGIFALVFTVTMITIMIYSMHKNRLADALKREFLERAMTADEIATVVGAKTIKRGESGNA